MSGEVFHLNPPANLLDQHVLARISEVIAVLGAIEAGELLAALPDCEVARRNHQMAVTLISLAERELTELQREMT